MLWDIFCTVIDNHGDIGVCWRLSRALATRGQRVRLWVDDASALEWMAPGGQPGVDVRAWRGEPPRGLPPGDVLVEAFGCDIPPEWARATAGAAPRDRHVWLNLEYLSAEAFVERSHRLPSPVLGGPLAGWRKWFFYPGFTPATGGLLREPDLLARQAAFDRAPWLRAQGIEWQGERVVSLFCYEPAALPELLHRLETPGQAPTLLLLTPGRATEAVRALRPGLQGSGALRLHRLPALPQTEFDHLLWASDLNFVRGEDSLVRALWAARPFIWHIYPQHDGAHLAKLAAFLDWMDAPAALRAFHTAWNAASAIPLPPLDLPPWQNATQRARDRLLAQEDLATQLLGFVLENQ